MKNFNLLNMNQGLTQFQPPIKNINESEYANYESTINVLDEKTIDIFPKNILYENELFNFGDFYKYYNDNYKMYFDLYLES